MFDVLSFGEVLIDFVPIVSGFSLADSEAFKKAPGGAPANVAVGLARLGIKSAFMGMVGDDAFGHFLVDVLCENNVDVQGVRFSEKARTALAFVSLQKNGERDFMFYRNPSADMLFEPQGVDTALIRSAKIFHFGSITLINEPVRSATRFALETAMNANCLISYDPNLRINLWTNDEQARTNIMSVWSYANIIKISEEELVFLSSESDLEKGVQKIWHSDIRLLVITRGAKGAMCITPDFRLTLPGYKVEVVDTTGAGDGFVAGLLAGLVNNPNAFQNESDLLDICQFANAVGALTTTQRGAIPALPTLYDVRQFQQSLK